MFDAFKNSERPPKTDCRFRIYFDKYVDYEKKIMNQRNERNFIFSVKFSLGCVLGPLIFIVFINDVVNLCDDVNESDIGSFADMTIDCSSANIENLYLRMNLI